MYTAPSQHRHPSRSTQRVNFAGRNGVEIPGAVPRPCTISETRRRRRQRRQRAYRCAADRATRGDARRLIIVSSKGPEPAETKPATVALVGSLTDPQGKRWFAGGSLAPRRCKLRALLNSADDPRVCTIYAGRPRHGGRTWSLSVCLSLSLPPSLPALSSQVLPK